MQHFDISHSNYCTCNTINTVSGGIDVFVGRYRYAASTSVSAAKPDAKSCSQLLESVGLKNWQIGHSKV